MQAIAQRLRQPDVQEEVGTGEDDDDASNCSSTIGKDQYDDEEHEEDWTLPAEYGEEGISVWNLMGEGFLQEVAALGLAYSL